MISLLHGATLHAARPATPGSDLNGRLNGDDRHLLLFATASSLHSSCLSDIRLSIQSCDSVRGIISTAFEQSFPCFELWLTGKACTIAIKTRILVFRKSLPSDLACSQSENDKAPSFVVLEIHKVGLQYSHGLRRYTTSTSDGLSIHIDYTISKYTPIDIYICIFLRKTRISNIPNSNPMRNHMHSLHVRDVLQLRLHVVPHMYTSSM
jgi:hypothetical protein